jgi:hypothetical protein
VGIIPTVTDALDGAPLSADDHRLADRQRAPHVSALRERVYATLTGLSTVALLWSYLPETTAGEAAADIASAMGALWLAGTFAEVSAHRVAYGRFPKGAHLRHIAVVGGQTLETALLPLLSVAGAALGWWTTRTALLVAGASLVLTIVVLGVLATRRLALRLPVRIAVIAVEVAIAVLVIAVKLLAH